MAISATHYQLLKSLPIDRGSTLLEIGEANWYGDCAVDFPCEPTEDLFTVAKACYAAAFAPERVVSIDRNGTLEARRDDLNAPNNLGEQFDIVINHGTAEHIFNIAQVFKTIHDHCHVDGWMIHDAPFYGWVDHGFYCLQPTLFYDLARANCYEVTKFAVHKTQERLIVEINSREDITKLADADQIPNNAMLFVAFRKRFEVPFQLPLQAYYAGTLSQSEIGRAHV
jgi:hypothetical protein